MGRVRRLDRIGIQLYSVRDLMQRDMPGTLARIAEIGYKDVEFAGYFGRTPAEVRQLLERNGLGAPSTHIGFTALGPDWEKALDFAASVGHTFATVPWIDEKERKTLADWHRHAAGFNKAAERARAHGLRFAYHNHDFEFKPVEGVVPFDLLLRETDPALVSYEMDVYWVTEGGADPKAYFRQHPDRFVMLHIKDSAGPPKHEQVDVGAGTIDFASILRLDAEQKHVVKHVFVEHDQPPDPMAFAKKSFDYLSKLEF
jgi:sugar phosphate isomerase/epimerase